MSDRVAAYSGLVADLARRHAKGQGGTSIEAEYDDLHQEGLINVWQTLERGITPTAAIIEGRMVSWKRLMKFQSGRGGHMDTSYATLLPLEDVHQRAGA
jgi:hypothetical protein